MKSSTFFSVFWTRLPFLLLLFGVISCSKVSTVSPNSQESKGNYSEERAFINSLSESVTTRTLNSVGPNIPSKKQKKYLISSQSEVIQSPQLIRFNQIKQALDWNSALVAHRGDLSFTIVPAKEDTKRFRDHGADFFRSAIFYKSSNDINLRMAIIELLTEKNIVLPTNKIDIIKTAFMNKIFSESTKINSENMAALFFDEQYKRQASFKIVNGNWTPARIDFRSDLDINTK